MIIAAVAAAGPESPVALSLAAVRMIMVSGAPWKMEAARTPPVTPPMPVHRAGSGVDLRVFAPMHAARDSLKHMAQITITIRGTSMMLSKAAISQINTSSTDQESLAPRGRRMPSGAMFWMMTEISSVIVALIPSPRAVRRLFFAA